jgi:hypothetical protein
MTSLKVGNNVSDWWAFPNLTMHAVVDLPLLTVTVPGRIHCVSGASAGVGETRKPPPS